MYLKANKRDKFNFLIPNSVFMLIGMVLTILAGIFLIVLFIKVHYYLLAFLILLLYVMLLFFIAEL